MTVRLRHSLSAGQGKEPTAKSHYSTMALRLFACFWIVFAVAWFLRDSPYRYLYTALGTGYALALFLLARLMEGKRVWAWWVTALLVGFGILISVFDEVGWADVLYLLFSGAVFFTLLRGRPKGPG